MTAAIFRGKRRRAAAAVGAVTFGLVALSACDKPTPLATVTVGSTTVTAEACAYNDGEAVDTEKVAPCLKDAGKTVKASMEDKVRFGVDPKIADEGWSLFINGQPAEQEPNKKTYRTIPASAFFSAGQGAAVKKTQISIVETTTGKALGVWNFTLERDS
ncbi:DUF2771 domain-containing protein [Streptomyces cinnamoneus]|uniref:Lipoprotein n=1 Tax=Streptomyces cinnamoneus TaxID=53446 RepID=A0A918U3D2_STRCJ|nr:MULTISPECIES: DUF2771 domain-containing protein [Streptomyces]MCA6092382.1 DUF2771 domain-containing protein [Streptomyces sichuanensis]GHC71553.1 lipoprotein [Streptomyces cinnamoneus]